MDSDEQSLGPIVRPSESLNAMQAGIRVVTLTEVLAANGRVLFPSGAVGVILRASADPQDAYHVRFPDGAEYQLKRVHLMPITKYRQSGVSDKTLQLKTLDSPTFRDHPLFEYVIFRCVTGSRAYGLETEDSDTDYRGVFLPSADMHWSLFGVPDSLECYETQEAYWELQKFLVLALKANPNVLECLYSPLIEHTTPLMDKLLSMREMFLSRLIYQTLNGYVMSQFKKMQADLRNHGQVKWKHVMHLLRLLLAGVRVLQDGHFPVRVEQHRDQLLGIKQGEMAWEETEKWRLSLHMQFDAAYKQTRLPERPDYEKASQFLIEARRSVV